MRKHTRGLCRRALALLLVCTLSFSMLQITAFADETEPPAPSEDPTFAGVIGDPDWIGAENPVDQAQDQVDSFDAANNGGEGSPKNPPVNDPQVTTEPMGAEELENGGEKTTEKETITWDNTPKPPAPDEPNPDDSNPDKPPYESPVTVPLPEDNTISVSGKQETTTTTTTDSQDRVTGEDVQVEGQEKVETDTVEKTESSEKLSAEKVDDKYITPTENGATVQLTPAPNGTATGTATIGKVDMDKLVGDKAAEAAKDADKALKGTPADPDTDTEAVTGSAEQARIDAEKARVEELEKAGYVDQGGGIYVKTEYQLDEEGKPVTDSEGNPIVIGTLTAKLGVENIRDGTSTNTMVTYPDGIVKKDGKFYDADGNEVPKPSADPTGYVTETKITTTTTEHTEGFRQPGDKPVFPESGKGTAYLKDSTGREVLDENGNRIPIGESHWSQSADSSTITTQELIPVYSGGFDENGNPVGELIGYQHTTVVTVTAEDGSTTRTTTVETVHGEKVTIDTTTTQVKVKTETTEVKQSTQQPDREVTVTLTMGQDNSSYKETGWHYVGPDANFTATETDSTDLTGSKSSIDAPTADKKPLPDNKYWYSGTWYTSELGISTELTGNDTHNHMGAEHHPNLKLVVKKDDQGNLTYHYGYCTDLGMNIYTSQGEYKEVSMDTLVDKGIYDGYTSSTETGTKKAEIVSAIAMLGYWGAKEGTGSLADFKEMLTGVEGIDTTQITDGIALAATQAAIWYYGNSANKTGSQNDNVIMTDSSADELFGTSAGEKGDLAYKIYQYLKDPKMLNDALAGKAAKAKQEKETYAVTNQKITGATTVLNSTQDKTTGKISYTADISIGISVKPSELRSDDLCFVVTSGNKSQTYRLASDQVSYDEKTGTYTIKNVDVGFGADGKANVSFQLTGTQKLTSAKTVGFLQHNATGEATIASQAFVGVKEYTYDHKVNFGFSLGFSIADAIVNIAKDVQEVTTTHTETTRNWDTERHTENKYEYFPPYEEPTPEPTPTPSTPPTPTPGPSTPPEEELPEPTPPLADTPDDPEEELPDPTPPLVDKPDVPDEPDEPEEELPEPDVPLVPSEPEEELPEPDVPLADVPKTGDETMLWYALAMLSGCGLVILALTGKKKKENDA